MPPPASAPAAPRSSSLAVLLRDSALGKKDPRTATALCISGRRDLAALGSALNICPALTSLDLSRCALSSLAGLQALQQLSSLSLYYNAVADLAERSHAGLVAARAGEARRRVQQRLR